MTSAQPQHFDDCLLHMAKTPNSKTPNSKTPNSKTPDPTAPEPEVQPTEQLPLEAPPVSAGAAASGGATGISANDGALANEEPTGSVFRRHPLAAGVTVGVIAVVLVSGLTAWGVGAAVTASLSSSTSSQLPGPSATPGPAVGGVAGGVTKAAGRVAFRATIQSIDGSSWTIVTRKGQTVTIAVTSSTQFGTRKSAETASSFAVGDSIVVVGSRAGGGTPTATRVVNAADVGAGKAAAGNTAPGDTDSTPMPDMTTTPNT
jgi:Domain of unknown function (DUF5666)